ncbi:MAG: hypothetical protein R3A78_16485 [Polyangiales bacterium]|nr:PD40 domain-containing protein [Myxococcales bacterium]
MTQPWGVLAACILACGVSGCAEDATQVMVVVRSDLRVPPHAYPEIDTVRILVSRSPDAKDAAETPVALDGSETWPLTLAVTPAAASNTLYAHVVAERDGELVIERNAFVRFVTGEKRMLVVDLLRDCVASTCEIGETCTVDGCVSDDQRDAKLAAWTGKPPEPLTAPRLCAGEWTDIYEISVTENSDYDDDPSFTADLLEFYFSSNRGSTPDTWVAKRESSDALWGAPEIVPGIAGTASEETPQISRDGLRLWFASTTGEGDKDIFLSTRETRESPWSTPVALNLWNNESETDYDRDVGEFNDGRSMFFSSNHRSAGQSGDDYDIFVVNRVGDDFTQWGTPVRVSQVSVDGENDMGPFPSVDGSRLYFHRQHASTGDADLYVAEREPKTGEFGEPRLVTELSIVSDGPNDIFYEQDWDVSDDECLAMFSRQMVDPDSMRNVSNVYVATREE